jgi:hypothetical protein
VIEFGSYRGSVNRLRSKNSALPHFSAAVRKKRRVQGGFAARIGNVQSSECER